MLSHGILLLVASVFVCGDGQTAGISGRVI